MKKILITSSVIVFGLSLAVIAMAGGVKTQERYVLSADEVIEGNFYHAGKEVTLKGFISEDVVVAAGDVSIDGSVGEDALVAGGTVHFKGTAGDDIRIAGGTVIVSGAISRDAAIFGGTLKLLSQSSVGGDLFMAGGVLVIDGVIAGDVFIAGGDAVINGSVGGKIVSYAEQLTIGPSAVVNGDLVNKSERKAKVAEGAVINGEHIHNPSHVQVSALRGLAQIGSLASFLAILFGGLVCYWLFRNRSAQFTSHALAQFWKQALRGIVALIAIPVISFALIVSLLGAPIGGVLLLFYILLLILARIFSGVLLGGWINRVIFKKPDQVFTWQTIIGGNVVLFFISTIPLIGGIISLLFFLVGLGAFWSYGYRHFWKNR